MCRQRSEVITVIRAIREADRYDDSITHFDELYVMKARRTYLGIRRNAFI